MNLNINSQFQEVINSRIDRVLESIPPSDVTKKQIVEALTKKIIAELPKHSLATSTCPLPILQVIQSIPATADFAYLHTLGLALPFMQKGSIKQPLSQMHTAVKKLRAEAKTLMQTVSQAITNYHKAKDGEEKRQATLQVYSFKKIF